MDMRKIFSSSLSRSKSKRDCAAPGSPPTKQNTPSPKALKPTMPIAIPRRKTVCPPPCSPIRQQGSPDIVFNFDFSFSPCSFQGHGQIITRKDDWAPQFMQQRGRTNLVLAHQCHQQQKALCGLTRRNSSVRRHTEALYRNQPMRGLLAQALRTHEGAYSQGSGGDLEAEYSENIAIHDNEIIDADVLASAYASPTSSECSSVVFASPPRDTCSSDRGRQTQDQGGFADPGLTSAFQRSVASTSASVSNQTTSPDPFAHLDSPVHLASALPSPPATSRTTSVTSSPSSRVPLHPIFPHNRSSTHLLRTAAAEPIVCLNVAEAQRPERPRGRSPYPSGPVYHGRRSSSAGSRPTVTTLGRTRSSLVLSNEELERSLEKDVGVEPGRGLERGTHGREELDEKEMVRGWEMEYERGRTRGRTRGRGITVARAPPVHV
ncbi:hypothetical protein FOMPIDRAFT_1061230 [Fomitopsis schrenkii]|uniref:Uncharacterized protein n=1 Tax=Fomitopsis schrenkii TaxID=2126942 RepID=S8FAM1_FOMSC|nr:hypothetical protein FOMPIDRAFT_1061230 [Fomitopsis schrenkii]